MIFSCGMLAEISSQSPQAKQAKYSHYMLYHRSKCNWLSLSNAFNAVLLFARVDARSDARSMHLSKSHQFLDTATFFIVFVDAIHAIFSSSFASSPRSQRVHALIVYSVGGRVGMCIAITGWCFKEKLLDRLSGVGVQTCLAASVARVRCNSIL